MWEYTSQNMGDPTSIPVHNWNNRNKQHLFEISVSSTVSYWSVFTNIVVTHRECHATFIPQTYQYFIKKIQMKYIFNQYLEIGGRLQPTFANFELDFLLMYWFVWEDISKTCKFFFWFLNADKMVKKTVLRLVFSTSLSVFRKQRKNSYSGWKYYFTYRRFFLDWNLFEEVNHWVSSYVILL